MQMNTQLHLLHLTGFLSITQTPIQNTMTFCTFACNNQVQLYWPPNSPPCPQSRFLECGIDREQGIMVRVKHAMVLSGE